MKWKTIYNATPSAGEVNTLPSLVVPDEPMSLKEIMMRHAKGLPINEHVRVSHYSEEEIWPDLEHMDYADRQEYFERVSEEFEQMKDALVRKKLAVLNAEKKIAETDGTKSNEQPKPKSNEKEVPPTDNV